MRRRDFIAGLGSAAAAWPVVGRAQQSTMPVIGYLSTGSPELFTMQLTAFRRGLGETGYIEGKNLTIQYGWAKGQYDRLPDLAADMVRQKVKAIVSVGGVPTALIAKAATTTIPIIFTVGGDPVAFGLVRSLNRPGANLTGTSGLNVELGPKKLELLHEMTPSATRIALLMNPTNPAAATDRMITQEAARRLSLELQVVNAATERDIDTAFDELRADGLLIGNDLFFDYRTDQIASLTIRHRVPAVWRPSFARAGGLMGYGGDLTETNRVAGSYTGRILNGEKPGDLPIQQVTKVELVINAKTARALGLTIPETLLATADEVIQ